MDITLVTKKNRSYFQPLMPEVFWRKSDMVIGAIDKNRRPCALIALREEETLLQIVYIYVAEEQRRDGIATGLLSAVDDVARSTRADGAYCQFVKKADEPGLDELFSENGYDLDEEGSQYYVTCFKDLNADFFRGGRGIEKGDAIRPLTRVQSRIWNQFMEALNQSESELVPELEPAADYDQECSFLYLKDGEPRGCILVQKEEEAYILKYLCMLGNRSPMALMELFARSFRVIEERGDVENPIYINALTETTEKMVQKMTGGKAVLVGRAITRYIVY